VSEETEKPEPGPEGIGAGLDPTATALALGGASREEADALLARQRRLIDLQIERIEAQESHIKEEERLKLSHLRIRRFGDYAQMALEISVGLLVLALVAGISLMVWNAAHADGLVIESFSVPPELATRGLTGQVMASQLLDTLGAMQKLGPPGSNRTTEFRSISGGWGDDIKVEIPDTGISLGEVYRFLRKWLGHETTVAGEIYRTQDGLGMSVRIDGSQGATYTGSGSALDELVRKGAEHILDVAQPDEYGAYLMSPRVARPSEAQAVLERAAGDPALAQRQRAIIWNELALFYDRYKGDERTANVMLRRSLAANPESVTAYSNLVGEESRLGHDEAVLAMAPAVLSLLNRHVAEYLPDYVSRMRVTHPRYRAAELGDYGEAARLAQLGISQVVNPVIQEGLQENFLTHLAQQHDGSAERLLARLPPTSESRTVANRAAASVRVEAALEHWPAVIALEPVAEKAVLRVEQFGDVGALFGTSLRPQLALAKTRLGDVAGAQATIAATPGDCYNCVRYRGLIAATAKQWGRADYWFARAVHDAPSIPFGYTDWGQTLLERGKPDEAIEKFKIANQKGPHFADPLEGWGEALMAKNQSHLALVKFKEAEKYAPNWGRLHLKWGEALGYAGKLAEAKQQFARTAQLDLMPSEKAELARMH
jgi:Tfp pilus assembly protein PilF